MNKQQKRALAKNRRFHQQVCKKIRKVDVVSLDAEHKISLESFTTQELQYILS